MKRDDYRATAIVMFGLAAASLTGFLRQAVIAHQLGAGRAADIYLVAFAVPEFIFIALPIILPPVLLPLFAEWRQQAGEIGAWRLGLQVAGASLAGLLLFTALAGLGAPLYLAWLSPGFAPLERTQAVQTTRLMLPAIGLMGLATLAGTTLQVYRRFARPALATAVYNLTFVSVLAAAPLAQPLNRAAWGVMLGAAAALVLQVPLLWRHRPPRQTMKVSQNLTGHRSVSQVARLAAPMAAGYAVHHAILFVDRAMATSLGAGSAAALNFAYHLALIIGQLSGLAVSTTLFPRLAEQVSDDDLFGARVGLSGALRFVWTVGLPATVGLILFRTPLVQVLFEHGAFDRASTAMVSAPLVWYALAVLADALCQPLWRAVYAQRNMRNVLVVNSLQTGIRLICNIALIGPFGYNALALSAFLGLSAQLLVLGWIVRRWLGTYLPRAWWRHAVRVTLATAVAAFVAGLSVVQLFGKIETPPTTALAAVTLVASGALSGLTYMAVLWVLTRSTQRPTDSRSLPF